MHDARAQNGRRDRLRRRDLLEGILTTSVSAILVAGPDGRFHFVNDRAAAVLGVPLDQILGRRHDDPAWEAETFDGTPLPATAYPFALVCRTGAPQEGLRVAIRTASGERRLLSVNAAPLAKSGDVVFSVSDITAEEEARAAHTRLLEILEATPDVISMMDMDRRVVYMNAAGRHAAGLPPSTPGHLGFDVLAEEGPRHPDWVARKLETEGIPTALHDGVWEGETALIDTSGREIAMSQVILAHTDANGRVDRLSTLMRDISEQRTARRQLAETANRLERILNVNPTGIYALSIDPESPESPARACLISQGMVDISGRSMPDWMEDAEGIRRAVIHPDDLPRFEEGQKRLRDDGFLEQEYRILRPGERTPAWISDRMVLLSDGAGRPTEIIGAWLDISDRHAVEEELRRSNGELEQFAYVTSHDLQEPLRMVSAYLGLLRRRLGDRLDAECTEFMDFAVDGAERMHRMINDLLAYSRVDRMGAPFAAVDAATALHAALANLHKALEDCGGTVEIAGSAPLPHVWADGGQLSRVFQNLIGNALKYRRPDIAPRITLSAAPCDEGWHFTVRDNGIGIAEKDFGRVFQIFQRLHPRSGAEGTGIGLSICKRIIERHDGRIWLESTVGEGTAFHFTLPAPADED